jgi:hypothetical protein
MRLLSGISTQLLIVLMFPGLGIRLSLDNGRLPAIARSMPGVLFRIALNGFVRQADETIRRGARQHGNELLQCRPRDQRAAASFDGCKASILSSKVRMSRLDQTSPS